MAKTKSKPRSKVSAKPVKKAARAKASARQNPLPFLTFMTLLFVILVGTIWLLAAK